MAETIPALPEPNIATPAAAATQETCTTVTTTTTEQVSTNELASSIGQFSPIQTDSEFQEVGHHHHHHRASPGKVSPTTLSASDYIPHGHHQKRVTEVIESTLALSTEIVLSKDEDEDDEAGVQPGGLIGASAIAAGNDGEDVDGEGNENDVGLNDADLDLDFDMDANDELQNDYQMIRCGGGGTTSGAGGAGGNESFGVVSSRKKSVFINEGLVSDEPSDRRSLFKANSAETSGKKRNSNGKNEAPSSSNNQRRPSTLQRLFKLKL